MNALEDYQIALVIYLYDGEILNYAINISIKTVKKTEHFRIARRILCENEQSRFPYSRSNANR